MSRFERDSLSLCKRVEKLEKQNRLFKRGGLVVLLALSAVAVMGQARPPRTVKAQSFILQDAQGNERAILSMVNDSPMLEFLDLKEGVKVRVSDGGYAFYDSAGTMTINADTLDFTDKQGRILSLSNESDPNLSGLRLSDIRRGHSLSLSSSSDGVTLTLSDSHGFSTTIGNSVLLKLSTGEKHVTSAASIRMSNHDGTVIWTAPPQ